MLPTYPIDYVREEIPHIREFVQSELAPLSTEQLNWQSYRKEWSVGQCLNHLLKANRSYSQVIEQKLTSAPSIENQKPINYGLVGRYFINMMAPSPSFKIPAPPAIRPQTSQVDPGIIERFLKQQDDIENLGEQASAHDLSVKVSSPFFRLLRLQLGEAFVVMIQHDHRHLNQAKRVMEREGFPVYQT
jgi:hypothetical protein